MRLRARGSGALPPSLFPRRERTGPVTDTWARTPEVQLGPSCQCAKVTVGSVVVVAYGEACETEAGGREGGRDSPAACDALLRWGSVGSPLWPAGRPLSTSPATGACFPAVSGPSPSLDGDAKRFHRVQTVLVRPFYPARGEKAESTGTPAAWWGPGRQTDRAARGNAAVCGPKVPVRGCRAMISRAGPMSVGAVRIRVIRIQK